MTVCRKAIPSPAPQGYAAMQPMIAALMQKGDHQGAMSRLHGALAAFGPRADLVADMATCCWRLGDEASAISLMEAVTQDNSPSAEALAKLGAMYLSTGDAAKARTALEKALSLRPGFVSALAALNQIHPYPRDGHRVRMVRKLLKSAGTTRQERSSLHGILGRVEEAGGGHALALAHYARSRALIPGAYDPRKVEAQVKAQIDRYDPAIGPCPGQDAAGPRIVFIVGMPRSGTTLAESIFLRHPQVASLGESHALKECLAQWRRTLEGRDEWGEMAAMGPQRVAWLRSIYLSVATRGLRRGLSPVLIDKTPLNLFHLGFARAIFPDCRFICMSRHPLDVGISNFGAAFGEAFVSANPFLKSLDHIGHFSKWAWASILDHQQKLGVMLRLQSYRRLVEDMETQAPALIAHAGLEWDKA